MANNNLDTFLRHMDTSAWRVTSLRHHPYDVYTYAVILQALIPVDLYDEIRHDIHTVAPYDYVIGYIDPVHGCMRVKMHTNNMEIVLELSARQTTHVADIELGAGTSSTLHFLTARRVIDWSTSSDALDSYRKKSIAISNGIRSLVLNTRT